MSKLIKTLTVAAAGIAFATPAAFAGETKELPMEASVATEMSDSRVMTLRNEAEAEVRGAVASGEFIAVEGPDGRVYYNRLIPVSELPDPTLDIEVADSYTYEYRGMTFTNKIVRNVG